MIWSREVWDYLKFCFYFWRNKTHQHLPHKKKSPKKIQSQFQTKKRMSSINFFPTMLRTLAIDITMRMKETEFIISCQPEVIKFLNQSASHIEHFLVANEQNEKARIIAVAKSAASHYEVVSNISTRTTKDIQHLQETIANLKTEKEILDLELSRVKEQLSVLSKTCHAQQKTVEDLSTLTRAKLESISTAYPVITEPINSNSKKRLTENNIREHEGTISVIHNPIQFVLPRAKEVSRSATFTCDTQSPVSLNANNDDSFFQEEMRKHQSLTVIEQESDNEEQEVEFVPESQHQNGNK